ncbi:MAG: hypothetical protein AAGB19_06155 [Cyanobacteria bacterium P01_F01_bin.3]
MPSHSKHPQENAPQGNISPMHYGVKIVLGKYKPEMDAGNLIEEQQSLALLI